MNSADFYDLAAQVLPTLMIALVVELRLASNLDARLIGEQLKQISTELQRNHGPQKINDQARNRRERIYGRALKLLSFPVTPTSGFPVAELIPGAQAAERAKLAELTHAHARRLRIWRFLLTGVGGVFFIAEATALLVSYLGAVPPRLAIAIAVTVGAGLVAVMATVVVVPVRRAFLEGQLRSQLYEYETARLDTPPGTSTQQAGNGRTVAS